MVGYVEAWTTTKPPVHPWIWGRVHPDYEGLGIGSWMLGWAEEHILPAMDELSPDLRFAPRVGIYAQSRESKKLFDDFGYHYLRSSYRMRINLEVPPQPPTWPKGLAIRTYDPETDLSAVYRTDQDVFRDHFGFIEEPYDEGLARFKHHMTEYEEFDPSLWFVAWDGDEVAGICLCRPHSFEDPEIGHVSVLGVRRPWRKRGLGLALLYHSFGEFYRRGTPVISLGVDAANPTGATRLYQKAGMHIAAEYVSYEKELRPGHEPEVEA